MNVEEMRKTPKTERKWKGTKEKRRHMHQKFKLVDWLIRDFLRCCDFFFNFYGFLTIVLDNFGYFYSCLSYYGKGKSKYFFRHQYQIKL